MPKQLIYTSAPRGIVPGQSGYCTVARSDEMREALILRLEQLSYYQHLSLSGGTERPISAYRIVDIRGTRYHVLSKIQDAGLDFTGRTNFIAHHLVFEPKEIGGFPSPPLILRDWPDWKKSWTQEPELLKNEDSVWNKIKNLAVKSNGEAKTWRVVTGNAENGYGLLDALRGTSFRVGDQTDIFGLFAESLELLEVRRKGFPNAAWDFTFTTSMQEQDNPADFLWRCIHTDNPAINALTAVHPLQWTDKEKEKEEKAFACKGRQPPVFVEQPKFQQIKEGETAAFAAKAAGIPTPNYQWYECDQNGKEKNKLDGQTSAKLVLENCKRGTTRYLVWATNGVGDDCRSDPVKLDVEPPKQPLTISKQDGKSSAVGRTTAQKPQVAVWEEPEPASSDSAKYISVWWLIAIFIAALAIGGAWWIKKHRSPTSNPGFNNGTNQVVGSTNGGSGTPAPVPLPTPVAPSNQPTSTQSADGKTASGEPKPQTERAVNSPPPTEFGLPDGWTQMIIGSATNLQAEYIPYIPKANLNPRFDLSAVADGFHTNGDNLFFVCKTNPSTGFQASLFSLQNDLPSLANSKRGIMIRESKMPTSPFLFIGASSQKIFAYLRDEKGELSFKDINIQSANQGKPVFLRLHQNQENNKFVATYAFTSNSKDEPSFQDYAISADKKMLIGFTLWSESPANLIIAHFIDVPQKNDSATNQ
jgi:hypothetical protein